MKDGQNVTQTPQRTLSDYARRAIAGIMTLAPSITAFGNTIPASYLRLVPNQEAPTNVCWGDRNRSVLVRVPLGWTSGKDMCVQVNPDDPCAIETYGKQTFEMRSPDCSADVYSLIAALCVAARKGFDMPDALDVAERTYVDVNIHARENRDRLKGLDCLPASCVASAECLSRQREAYEERGVFSPAMIDNAISRLRAYDDEHLAEYLKSNPEQMNELVNRYFHCG